MVCSGFKRHEPPRDGFDHGGSPERGVKPRDGRTGRRGDRSSRPAATCSGWCRLKKEPTTMRIYNRSFRRCTIFRSRWERSGLTAAFLPRNGLYPLICRSRRGIRLRRWRSHEPNGMPLVAGSAVDNEISRPLQAELEAGRSNLRFSPVTQPYWCTHSQPC